MSGNLNLGRVLLRKRSECERKLRRPRRRSDCRGMPTETVPISNSFGSIEGRDSQGPLAEKKNRKANMPKFDRKME